MPPTATCAWSKALLASGCAWAADWLFPVASLSLIYMTAVVAVSRRRGPGPAIVAAVLGFLLTTFCSPIRALPFRCRRRAFSDAWPVCGGRVEAHTTIAAWTNKLYCFSRRVAVATTLRCEAVLLTPAPTGGFWVRCRSDRAGAGAVASDRRPRRVASGIGDGGFVHGAVVIGQP
jgi:two-component system, OmpR family, sensor histidine kinase KdpD